MLIIVNEMDTNICQVSQIKQMWRNETLLQSDPIDLRVVFWIHNGTLYPISEYQHGRCRFFSSWKAINSHKVPLAN